MNVRIVTACMTSDGTPDFAVSYVDVSETEHENGVHYWFAEQQLHADGYEEPFVHFAEDESPEFLHAAVANYIKEKEPCLA